MSNELMMLLEKITALEKRLSALERREYTSGGGAGDMLKSTYDTDDDGVVDAAADADTVDSQHASAFAVAAKGVTNGDSHDHSGGDGAQIDHGGLGGLSDDDHSQYLRADGTRGLSADWDAGGHEIRAATFESDIANGTAPLTIASRTQVSNLNADLLDGSEGADYAKYVAVARTHLKDQSSGTYWDGSAARNTGTHTFRPTDNSDLWPTTAKAVVILMAAAWASAADGSYMNACRDSAGGMADVQVKALVSGYNIAGSGIVPLDANGYFYLVIVGANTTRAVVSILGYIA